VHRRNSYRCALELMIAHAFGLTGVLELRGRDKTQG
jgi:hypothetical protein